MIGQRILERLANGPLAYRALEKRVSAKYRKEQFKADFDQLKADGIIYVYKEGRTRFVALSCPGEPQPEPPKSPAVAIQFGRFHVGDTVRVQSFLSSGCGGSTSVQSQDQLEPIVEEQPEPMDIYTDFSFSEPAIENVFVPDYRPADNVVQENPKHGEEGHQHRFGDEDIISDDEVTTGEVDGKIAIVLPDRIIADLSKIVHESFEEVLTEEASQYGYLTPAASALPGVGTLVFVNETYMDELFQGSVGTVTGYNGGFVNVKIDELGFHGIDYIFLPEHVTPLKPEDGCGSIEVLGAPYAFEESGSYESNWFIPLSESVTNKLLRISKHLANLEDKTSCTTDHALNAAQKTLRQTFKLFV